MTGLWMKIKDDFNGYKSPSLALNEHFKNLTIILSCS